MSALSPSWDRVLVIPACDELEYLPGCLTSIATICKASEHPRVLVIVILNARAELSDEVHQHNRDLFDLLLKAPHQQLEDDLWYLRWDHFDVWLIDRFRPSTYLPPRQGVGLARSLGMERALALYQSTRLTSPWVWCSDADARFAADYFDPIPASRGAALMRYTHDPAPPELQRYEISMRYYVLGLRWAGSPYAYATIGSTIIVHLDSYRAARGFPLRQAGEDFYLLAKIAKQAPIIRLKRAPITIIGRESARVPFGTGPAMAQIKARSQSLPLYHPEIFARLKIWLETLNQVSDPDLYAALSAQAPDFPPLIKLQRLLKQSVGESRKIRRRHEWFDAFKTLKLIHHLRDRGGFASLPFDEALSRAPFFDSSATSLTALARSAQVQEETD